MRFSPGTSCFSVVEHPASPSPGWCFMEPLPPLHFASLLWRSPRASDKWVINITCFRSSFHHLLMDLSRKKTRNGYHLDSAGIKPRCPLKWLCVISENVFLGNPLISNVSPLPSFTDHWPQTKFLASYDLQMQLLWVFLLSFTFIYKLQQM